MKTSHLDSRWTTKAKNEHMEKLTNLNIPQEYKGRYKQLLVKQFGAISIDKNDLGRVKDFFPQDALERQ